jgi:hypothetical protein
MNILENIDQKYAHPKTTTIFLIYTESKYAHPSAFTLKENMS